LTRRGVAALAETGSALGQPELVECARASADALLLPTVESGGGPSTSDEQYAAAATRGRTWFYGPNTAGRPVYDARRGLVYDGIDNGTVSRNSGAESNIEGALALLS
jgi:hypothetical protein